MALSAGTFQHQACIYDKAAFRFEGNLRGLRQFIAGRAAAHGLSRDRAAMLVQAGGEVGSYLKAGVTPSATVRT